MKRILVRYKTKPERAPENQHLIEAVFRELEERAPEGFRYLVLRLGDGTFVHFVEREDDANPLEPIEAFRAFQSGIKERVLDPPIPSDGTIVGNYRMLRVVSPGLFARPLVGGVEPDAVDAARIGFLLLQAGEAGAHGAVAGEPVEALVDRLHVVEIAPELGSRQALARGELQAQRIDRLVVDM